MEIPARVRARIEAAAGYDAPAILHWRTPDDGCPFVACKIDGHPLEVRAWHREPDPAYGAVRLPSGIWVAIRFP